MIRTLELVCDDLEITSTANRTGYRKGASLLTVKAINVDEDEIMEALNFEDVMNYYGVIQVLEWAEANRWNILFQKSC